MIFILNFKSYKFRFLKNWLLKMILMHMSISYILKLTTIKRQDIKRKCEYIVTKIFNCKRKKNLNSNLIKIYEFELCFHRIMI